MEHKIVPLTSCSLKALAFNPRCKSFHQMYALHIEPFEQTDPIFGVSRRRYLPLLKW